jgi:aminoglycoside phosphotransferase (APT) family kinase protein
MNRTFDSLDLVELVMAAENGGVPPSRPLTGGVSSDISVFDTRQGPICVKRALSKLKVAADWRAPVERNHYEAEWMRVVGEIDATLVPRLLGENREHGWFAMEYLPPEHYPLWKSQMRDGAIDPAFAAGVGAAIARIHAATAGSKKMAQRFSADHIFFPIRLEAYLLAAAVAQPACAPALRALVDVTAATKLALVHGDVSPKNILRGPEGPVFLDAECAWYGDPAFDLAFCLNHMLLKCLWRPQHAAAYLQCFDALSAAYLRGVTWEPAAQIEQRAARLLPGLFLARVDGKSPVEYVTDEAQKQQVRKVALPLLLEPPQQLAQVCAAWASEMGVR